MMYGYAARFQNRLRRFSTQGKYFIGKPNSSKKISYYVCYYRDCFHNLSQITDGYALTSCNCLLGYIRFINWRIFFKINNCPSRRDLRRRRRRSIHLSISFEFFSQSIQSVGKWRKEIANRVYNSPPLPSVAPRAKSTRSCKDELSLRAIYEFTSGFIRLKIFRI